MYGGVSGQNWLGPMMVLIICGLVVGLALVSSDLINPITNWAEAQRYQSETQRIDEQNAVDIKQYESLREAQTQAEIQRLNEEIAQQAQLHQAELQRLSEEMQQQKRMNEEEIRQAQEMAALKLRLANTAAIVVASGVGLSLIILSLGITRRLWRNPTPSPRLVQASLRPLRPKQQQPLSQTWRTVSHQHSVQKGNGGGSHNRVPTP